MRKINKLVVHCSATREDQPISYETIKSWHVEGRGWSDIGYHYIVHLDGSISKGREDSVQGAHVSGHNRDSIGICYIGGVEQDGKTPKDTRTCNQKKIVDWFGGSVVTDLLGGLDNLFTSKEEKIKAETVIKQILIEKQLELQRMQTEIIVTEAKGNWLQRSWRPVIMLAFGFIVIYVKFIGPVFDLIIPELELLKIGIGGYVVGRSAEKISQNITISKK